MATYVMLVHFTEQGDTATPYWSPAQVARFDSKNLTHPRAEDFKQMAIKHGTTVKEIFWTLAQYDAVVVVEAQDEKAMTALGLSAGALGNVRTQTLRSFWDAEKKAILGKVA